VALLVMVAFGSWALAQTPAPAKTEKPAATAPAPAPAKAAPAPAAEKPKAEKPKDAKPLSFKGVIAAYEAGKMIKVKGAKNKEMTFDIAADAKMKGEAKEGAKVTVTYKKDGDKLVATGIAVPPPPKKKEPPKPPEKKG
jgi:Cu/Ag efflux protein CusF